MTAGSPAGTLVPMKRTLLAATAAASVAVVAAAHGQAAPTTLHLVDHNTGFVFNDVKPKQLPKVGSPGDTLTITGRLTCDRTGASHLVCTLVVGGKKEQELCQGDAALTDGDLFFTGRLAGDAPGKLAVTGGTGAYAGARGNIADHDGPHNTTVITITLGG